MLGYESWALLRRHYQFKTIFLKYPLPPFKMTNSLIKLAKRPIKNLVDYGEKRSKEGGFSHVAERPLGFYSWPCRGLFSRIPSILSNTSESSFGATSSAFMFSLTCSGRLAPVMTVLTFGFFRHQASAN